MFEKPGLFGWNVQNAGGFLPDEMHAAGFGWIALLLHDSLTPVETVDYREFIGRYRSKGIEVAGWGVIRDHPEEEANLAADLLQKLDLHAYIADGEQELGLTQGAAGQVPECFGRSDLWVEAFRKRTDMELGFSSYAILAQHDAHYVPWINAGAVAMPQTYTNEFAWATPQAGVVGALDLNQPHNLPNGWPRHLIYPTIGNYDDPKHENPTPTAEQYAELLRAAKVSSFSIYLAENVKEGELQHYAGVCVPPEVVSAPEPATPVPAKAPLSQDEVPYTGPCYSLSDDRGPTNSPTVSALKIAMRRLNVAPIPDLTDYYSLELENAMRIWQQRVGISPATGQYGRASYEKLLGALTAKGNNAFDERAIGLIKSEVVAPVPGG
jgi:hypothetical protein